MQLGNITLSSPKRETDLITGFCSSCGEPCSEVNIDESFRDLFGQVSDWSVGSDCCEAEVCGGAIFLDKQTIHTAQKDHRDKKGNITIRSGQKYKATIRKGYFVRDGEHVGFFRYTKNVLA